MQNVIINEKSLNNSEITFLQELCSNFVATSTPEQNNHYFKQTIVEHKQLDDFLSLSKNTFKSFGFHDNKQLHVQEVWINEVSNQTNKEDNPHTDINQLTSVTFLNEDFEGGCLEIYDNEKIIKIEPKKGKTVFFQGSKMYHRVLPVKNGKRYTMVTFWNWITKDKNTIL